MPAGKKLRFDPLDAPFRVVLVEPEIPGNTGAVARTCVGTGSALHLVGKLGFDISDHAVRRAGLDYWPLLDLHRHDTLSEFNGAHPGARLSLFSANAPRSYLEAELAPGDAIVFGKESVGLGPELLAKHADRVFGIPTVGGVRSLNLSNAVSIVLYEGLRRSGAMDQTEVR
ncbi:MAG: tRNA (cytidine(34)-2'-O)-methyltransferase [Sandaracinaceae bacterium]